MVDSTKHFSECIRHSALFNLYIVRTSNHVDPMSIIMSIFAVFSLQVDLFIDASWGWSPHKVQCPGRSLDIFRRSGRSLHSFRTPGRSLKSFRRPNKSAHRFRLPGRLLCSFRNPGRSVYSFRSRHWHEKRVYLLLTNLLLYMAK